MRTPTGLTGDNIDQQLVSLVHARVGRPGVYYVHSSHDIGAVGVYGVYAQPGAELAQDYLGSGIFSGEDQVSGALPHSAALGDGPRVTPGGDAAVLLDLTGHKTLTDPFVPGSTTAQLRPVLPSDQVHALTAPPWVEPGYVDTGADHLQPPSTGLTSLVAVAVGLGVLLISFRLLRLISAWRLGTAARPGRPETRPRQPLRGKPLDADERDPEALRASAKAALDDLDRALTGRAATTAGPLALARATGSRDAAAGLLDSSDVLDLVGARVLALGGSRALARPGASAYQPCFVDPRHGAATTQTRVRGGVDVPTCRACHDAVEAGVAPSPLFDRRGRPYYRGRTVWARTGFGATDDDLWSRVLDDLDRR